MDTSKGGSRLQAKQVSSNTNIRLDYTTMEASDGWGASEDVSRTISSYTP